MLGGRLYYCPVRVWNWSDGGPGPRAGTEYLPTESSVTLRVDVLAFDRPVGFGRTVAETLAWSKCKTVFVHMNIIVNK